VLVRELSWIRDVRGLRVACDQGRECSANALMRMRHVQNGIYMKMMNFRRFDPAFTSAGKVDLTRGNKDEEEVWVSSLMTVRA
jgi:hypothetical protein